MPFTILLLNSIMCIKSNKEIAIPEKILKIRQKALNTISDIIEASSVLILRQRLPNMITLTAIESKENPFYMSQSFKKSGSCFEKMITGKQKLVITNNHKYEKQQNCQKNIIALMGMPLLWTGAKSFEILRIVNTKMDFRLEAV